MSSDLALRTTVRDLVAAFVAAERAVRAAFAQIVAAEQAVNAAFLNGGDYPAIRVSACGNRYHDNFKDADDAVEIMTRAAWKAIVERLELRRFMSIRAYDEMGRQLDREKLPPVTEENVLRFAHDHLARARAYLKEAVDEVFQFLRPRRWTTAGQLKTNTGVEVPEKVILPNIVGVGYRAGSFRVNYHYSQNLLALENVLSALDGQGEIHKLNQSALQTAIEASADGTGETPLFIFRACKNGNLHLQFKRVDLLQRFNMLAGGANLRPGPTEEERLRAEIAKARAENERLKKRGAAA
jgi:hypothetical protein